LTSQQNVLRLYLFIFEFNVCPDPDYKNFKSLPDDHRIPLTTLINKTNEFFPDLKRVGRKYIEHYKTERELHYADKEEMRMYLKYGVVFFVATTLLDAYLITA
jgi:hypothetical protein